MYISTLCKKIYCIISHTAYCDASTHRRIDSNVCRPPLVIRVKFVIAAPSPPPRTRSPRWRWRSAAQMYSLKCRRLHPNAIIIIIEYIYTSPRLISARRRQSSRSHATGRDGRRSRRVRARGARMGESMVVEEFAVAISEAQSFVAVHARGSAETAIRINLMNDFAFPNPLHRRSLPRLYICITIVVVSPPCLLPPTGQRRRCTRSIYAHWRFVTRSSMKCVLGDLRSCLTLFLTYSAAAATVALTGCSPTYYCYISAPFTPFPYSYTAYIIRTRPTHLTPTYTHRRRALLPSKSATDGVVSRTWCG